MPESRAPTTRLHVDESPAEQLSGVGTSGSERERWAITVTGIVQGVGFRPFVFEVARSLELTGFVRNESGCVHIQAEGKRAALESFVTRIMRAPPPLARVDRVDWARCALHGDREFLIVSSDNDACDAVFISPDIATCDDCVRELFDAADRRYRYPFLNCTNCGPRLTIVKNVPYDRERTTMAGFAMCPACRAEYEDRRDRRFHAQPIACPACGPQLSLLGCEFAPMAAKDTLRAAVDAIRAGQVGAVKGLGGYHFVCDATSALAVAGLRARKQRDEKPFAVMVADSQCAARICQFGPEEKLLLESRARPIVLLAKRAGCNVAEAVAPGNPRLGVMLPYTPLHHLLLRALEELPVVMTSGNRSDEPIAFDDARLAEQLGGIADFYLTHNRPIHLRCDDSVVRFVRGAELPIRRSRGYAPAPLTLPEPCRRHVLAVGGQLKSVFALGRRQHAFLSHHIGDLDHYAAYHSFADGIEHFERLFAHRPELIAHDLHPDYSSTRYAVERAEREGITRLAVQHHHAHLASCMAENGLHCPVIGVAFDGTGYGADGAIWGGEFLVGDYGGYRRAAHFRYVPMPGGERAIHEPWRMGLTHLLDAGVKFAPAQDWASKEETKAVEKMIAQRINAPLTSSVGRLFDGVAAIAGGRTRVSFEGQAAMELEGRALESGAGGDYPFEILPAECGGHESPWQIDVRPLITALADERMAGARAAAIARRFHSTLVEIIAQVCTQIRQRDKLNQVVLSGGVFMNGVLLEGALSRLSHLGFEVYRHRHVPPNDGGLALGQLAIAAAYDRDCE